MSTPFPAREVGLALHARLLLPDLVAWEETCAAYLRPLVAYLAGWYPGCDPHLIQTAAEDALMALLQRPDRFDSQRGDLAAYLQWSARGDLNNALDSQRRHAGHEFPVEDLEARRNTHQSEPDAILIRLEDANAARRCLEAHEAACTDAERAVLGLMRDGEYRTAEYAAALGIGHLPAEEQRREVKRVRDRVTRRIERGGDGDDGPPGRDGRAGAA